MSDTRGQPGPITKAVAIPSPARDAMKRLLRWLNPNTLQRGAVFGFLFGFLGTESLLLAFVVRDNFQFKPPHFYLIGPVVWAIPWVVMWTLSGWVCELSRSHLGTIATVCAFAFGVGYSFWEGPKEVHPWLLMTVPFYTFLTFIACQLFVLLLGAVIGWVRDPEEAE